MIHVIQDIIYETVCGDDYTGLIIIITFFQLILKETNNRRDAIELLITTLMCAQSVCVFRASNRYTRYQ